MNLEIELFRRLLCTRTYKERMYLRGLLSPHKRGSPLEATPTPPVLVLLKEIVTVSSLSSGRGDSAGGEAEL